MISKKDCSNKDKKIILPLKRKYMLFYEKGGSRAVVLQEGNVFLHRHPSCAERWEMVT